MKNNVIQANFGGNPELNIDKLYNDLDPILNELTDVACNSLGEEEGCLYIQALSDSIHKVADKLASKVEIKQNNILSMDNGDIIDLTLETNE
jgi:hypothetical protein